MANLQEKCYVFPFGWRFVLNRHTDTQLESSAGLELENELLGK